ncbi:MAG TPA: L,D-transpeptidase [Thermoanaerobaculia bacterium]|nr:L,D-transpeptidase [Thermoanaerobaculia bacterium]
MSVFRPDRRSEPRDDSSDRRQFPRPPLWLNLTVLAVALAGLALAHLHRKSVHENYADVLAQRLRTPDEVNRMKESLAEMDLSREQLVRELEGRKEMVEALSSDGFYLSVDSEAKTLRFHYGGTVLREADLEVGPPATFEDEASGKSWTFVPVKGAFPIEGKIADHSWRIPEWVYVMNGEAIPGERPVMRHGLGRYVILLPHDYVIHSPPAEGSPLDGPKPGSVMIDEADLRAIWPRIHRGTKVYIF